MHTFFHGWRRKAGVVTLVMACVFLCEWMSSRVHRRDFLLEMDGPRYLILRSHDGAVRMVRELWPGPRRIRAEEILVIPYVAIVLALTLLSAYLMLWKQRKRA
jgi:hypothetical protein